MNFKFAKSPNSLPSIVRMTTMFVFMLVAVPALEAAQTNSWSNYFQGTWVRVETITEEADQNGILQQTGLRTTRTFLDEKNDAGVHLTIETEVELNGRRIEVDPRTTTASNATITERLRLNEGELTEGVLDFQTRTIPCKIRREIVTDGDKSWVRVDYVNEDVYPYVLRREIRVAATENEGEKIIKKTEVIEFEIPEQMFGSTRLCALVRTTEFNESGSLVQLETICPNVPGELVRRSVVERNHDGQVTRRVSTELVELGWNANRDRQVDPSSNFQWRRFRFRRIRSMRDR